MLEKFSTESQKVIASAESISYDLSYSSIGLEHLLLAILRVPEILLTMELRKYKVTFKNLLSEIKEMFPIKEHDLFFMEYTLELKSVFEDSIMMSKEYKEDKVSVNCLCISLIKNMQGVCLDILNKYKVSRNDILSTLVFQQKKHTELDKIIDLHNLAELKKDPLVGREKELEQLIMALKRRNKPNALIVGAPGVGKTALVEELAKRLKNNEIKGLEGKIIYELDISSVVGGTKYRGEFEEKMKKIIRQVKEDGNAILFIDEIHNIIKAGGAEGAIDASNILKPYLSRGEIQVIGATTTDEYHKIFEKDKALNRRFQLIKMEPSTKEETLEILFKLRPIYEDHYKITIDDSLIELVVDLSATHLPHLSFPDKAIDILDNACVSVTGELFKSDIVKVMENYYNITIDEATKSKQVFEALKDAIYGQDEALLAIYNNLLRVEKGFYDKSKPLLSLFFVGPSGVGKTETAKIIAREFLKSEEAFIKLDMALYQDTISLNKLIGSPPGYSGFDEIPSFVTKMKTHPHAVVLLDEMEKAHVDVCDLFLNILDEGYFYDAHGEKIDCKNAIFIMTSNLGFSIDSHKKSPYDLTTKEDLKKDVYKMLSHHFRLELLNRIDEIISFSYIDESAQMMMLNKYLNEFKIGLSMEQSLELDNIKIDKLELERFGIRYVKRVVLKKMTELLNDMEKQGN